MYPIDERRKELIAAPDRTYRGTTRANCTRIKMRGSRTSYAGAACGPIGAMLAIAPGPAADWQSAVVAFAFTFTFTFAFAFAFAFAWRLARFLVLFVRFTDVSFRHQGATVIPRTRRG